MKVKELLLFTLNDHITMGSSKTFREIAGIEFNSILRLRPLLKKERDDHIVVEPVYDSSQVVCLHPQPTEKKDSNGALIGSPDAVQLVQDTDFHFDRILAPDVKQDKVYLSVGLPIALAAMANLKSPDSEEISSRYSHLIITMGQQSSGKTYTCFGNLQNLSSRKSEADGLIPRMLESLFSQSKHTTNSKNLTFSVNLSVLQVNQNKSNPSDCDVYDLSQPSTKTGGMSVLPSSAGRVASSILSSLDISNTGNIVGKYSSSNSSALHPTVEIQQDGNDCIVKNMHTKSCNSVEMAREHVQRAMERSRKLYHKRYQSHILVQMQPILVDKHGKVIKGGGQITVLDMASFEGTRQRSGRLKDALIERDDAHTAVLHCLRTIKYNETVLQEKQVDSSATKSTHQSFRKVPFLQHKVTMLLQQLFSSKNTDRVDLCLLLTVSPSHRDYDTKKDLMNEIESIHRPSLCTLATTGTKTTPMLTNSHRKTDRRPSKSSGKKVKAKLCNASDADDEGSFDGRHRAENVPETIIETRVCAEPTEVERSTLSDEASECLEPLPPPVAPGYYPTCPDANFASDSSYSMTNTSKQFASDFPGVVLPTESMLSSVASNGNGLEKIATAPSAPLEEGAYQSDPWYGGTPLQLLNYMKTFNKVVNASKKKGRQVIEKISVTASGSISKDISTKEIQKRLSKLEKKNNKLQRENDLLRELNATLTKENMDLKLSMQGSNGGFYQTTSHEDDDDSISDKSTRSSIDRQDEASETHHDQVISTRIENENLIEIHEQNDEYIGVVSTPRSQGSQKNERQSICLDNPFFQHMAQMHHDDHWDKQISNSVSKTRKEPFGRVVVPCRNALDSFDDENEENNRYVASSYEHESASKLGTFGDPLFQHMAQMNSEW